MCRIIEGECVDRWYKLIEILAYSVPDLLVCIVCSNVIYTAKHLHHILGEIQYRRNDEDTEKEVDQQSSLIEYPNQIFSLSLKTDLIGEPNIKTADEQVSKDKGKNSSHTHTHRDESAITATPPKIDDDDCATEYLADGGGQDGTQQVLLILLRLHL